MPPLFEEDCVLQTEHVRGLVESQSVYRTLALHWKVPSSLLRSNLNVDCMDAQHDFRIW